MMNIKQCKSEFLNIINNNPYEYDLEKNLTIFMNNEDFFKSNNEKFDFLIYEINSDLFKYNFNVEEMILNTVDLDKLSEQQKNILFFSMLPKDINSLERDSFVFKINKAIEKSKLDSLIDFSLIVPNLEQKNSYLSKHIKLTAPLSYYYHVSTDFIFKIIENYNINDDFFKDIFIPSIKKYKLDNSFLRIIKSSVTMNNHKKLTYCQFISSIQFKEPCKNLDEIKVKTLLELFYMYFLDNKELLSNNVLSNEDKIFFINSIQDNEMQDFIISYIINKEVDYFSIIYDSVLSDLYKFKKIIYEFKKEILDKQFNNDLSIYQLNELKSENNELFNKLNIKAYIVSNSLDADNKNITKIFIEDFVNYQLDSIDNKIINMDGFIQDTIFYFIQQDYFDMVELKGLMNTVSIFDNELANEYSKILDNYMKLQYNDSFINHK